MSKLFNIGDYYTKEVHDLVRSVTDRTIVVGGSLALHLAGIKLSHVPEDIDIIMYGLTEGEKEKIRNYCQEDKANDSASYVPDMVRRSYKVDVNGVVVNFLLEESEQPDDLLTKTLSFDNQMGSTMFYVQSIKNIISAQRQYGGVGYVRAKDVNRIHDIIINNFFHIVTR